MPTSAPKKTSCSDASASNFALLTISRIPQTHADFRKLFREGRLSRLLLGELVRTDAFREQLLAAPEDRREHMFVSRYRRVFHFPTHKTDRAIINEFLPFQRRADELIAWLLVHYVPERYHHRLGVRPHVRRLDDLVDHFLFCFPTVQDGPRAARERFEARRRLLLALYLYEIAMGEGREDLLEHDRLALAQYLDGRFFVPDATVPAAVRWIRDPRGQNRVARIIGPDEEVSREERPFLRTLDQFRPGLTCRFFRSPIGRLHPVLCLLDTKKPFAHLLKMVVKNQRATEAVRDLRRVMFIFRNRRELLLGLRTLRRNVWDVEGVVADQRWSIDGVATGDPRGSATSEEFKHMQFTVPVYGSQYEVQILLLADWLNAISSDGPEHHAQYKANQYYDRVFPVLFPFDLYRTNWQSPRIRKRFREKLCRDNER